MMRSNACRNLRWPVLAVLILLLAGCAFPQLEVTILPPNLTLLPGVAGTVTVTTTDEGCDPDAEFMCVDTTGQVFDVVVQNLPAGVTHSIDRSLRSPSTPGVVRITFVAGTGAVPDSYNVVVHVVLLGRSLGTRFLHLRVLPAAGIVSHPPVSIAAGMSHSLAALADGSVQAWGDNSEGELGDGSFGSRTLPVTVRNLDGIVGVAAGTGYSLALSANGRVWAWGSNGDGQLGVGDRIGRPVPVQVDGIHNVKAIAAGHGHSLALRTDGTVWGWGRNDTRQLGDGTLIDRLVPVQVQGLSGIQAIAAGGSHSLALATDRTVWAWGSNNFGRLGDGTRMDRLVPVQVQGLNGVQAIAAGGSHSLALAADGTVWAWGNNLEGELGDGTRIDRLVPVQVQGLSGVQALAAGHLHSMALAADGTVWAWGLNSTGQLGDGTTMNRVVPVQVQGPSGIQALAAGDSHSLAMLECGQVRAWGHNSHGQLGDGTRSPRTSRVPVLGIGDDRRCDELGLRVSVIGDGVGTVTGVAGALSCSPEELCTAIVDRGTMVDLTASAAADSVFEGWANDCEDTNPQTTVLMDRGKLCVAQFRRDTPEPFLLTVLSDGGHVMSSGGGILGPDHIDCGTTCHAIFPAGTVVTLAATSPNFTGWSGDCRGTAPETTVTITGARTCRANFRHVSLTMVVEGQGSVTSAPAGINCPTSSCEARYPAGTTVDLTAHPTPASMVSLWLDDCGAPGGLTNQIVMDSDKRCRIRFVERTETPRAIFSFTPAAPRVGEVVTFDGNASCVFDPATNTCDPATITSWAWDFDGDGAFEVSGGRTVAAIAQHAFPSSGDHPVRLRVEGGQFFGQADAVSVVPVQGTASLTLTVNNGGNGRVVSSPAGIDCPADCSESYDGGTSVTLTATPMAGFRVGGWVGCDAFNANQCTVVMGANRTVNVTFTPLPS